jgi:hypothetical protein
MAVDVTMQVVIARPRAEVALYAVDPDNARKWYENIEAVECGRRHRWRSDHRWRSSPGSSDVNSTTPRRCASRRLASAS